ncbi:hypothetical protein [Pinirhizobacter sp.]|jgi:hypothetical protein|uniref:hypothetical protein n=1 Tax=Pinirhizobacter sp. TaxID=2950432 RepID=UPI002F3F1ABE
MKNLLHLPSTYLGLPLLFSCALTYLSYDLATGYTQGLLLLAMMATATIVFDAWSRTRLPPVAKFRLRRYTGTREAFVALAYAWGVVLFCLIDLALFPIPLFDKPSSYAVMENGREHVRHISDMCWTLPVIGLLCARSKAVRNTLVFVGLVFPVLVIDRNRIFATFFSLALVIALRRDENRPLPWKRIIAIVLVSGAIFSILGAIRSGTLDTVALPFSALYRSLPQGLKWLLLYASAGPYNFGAIEAKHYINASFLINQLIPMSGSVATAGTNIPLDASNINVGTEFFPFLMAWGPAGAVGSMAALYAMLLWSVRRLRAAVSLFPLLIFLRVAYVCVMAPFAPQAFTWTNIGFVLLCLVLQLLAWCLPVRGEPRSLFATAPVARGASPSH